MEIFAARQEESLNCAADVEEFLTHCQTGERSARAPRQFYQSRWPKPCTIVIASGSIRMENLEILKGNWLHCVCKSAMIMVQEERLWNREMATACRTGDILPICVWNSEHIGFPTRCFRSARTPQNFDLCESDCFAGSDENFLASGAARCEEPPSCAADVAELLIHSQNGVSSTRAPRYFLQSPLLKEPGLICFQNSEILSVF